MKAIMRLLLHSADGIFEFATTSITAATFDPSLTKVGTSDAFTWHLGDGTESEGDSVSKVYTQPGIKKVRLEPERLYQFVTVLDLRTDDLVGSIPSLKNFPALENFQCHDNALTGSIPSLAVNTALVIFFCQTNNLTGSIPSLANNTALVTFRCSTNALTGSIPSLANNTALTTFRCSTNALTGSIPSLANNTALTTFFANSNSLIGMTNVECFAIADLRIQDNGMSQANVDAIINDIYTNRLSYTDGTPALNIGGTNATPSGTYQYSASPSTAKEKIYALENDDDSEGFNVWTITYTFGLSAHSSGFSLGFS